MAREKSPQQKLLERVKNDFSQHEASPQNEAVRADFRRLAQKMVKTLPPGREQSLVLTKLEEACFFANAALVRPQQGGESSVAPAPEKKAAPAKKTTRRVTRTARN